MTGFRIRAARWHDFSAGHRVVGHEGKCRHLHGHNYRVHFVCRAQRLDEVGRVLDFSAIKARLCGWLEEHWDHRLLLWEKDEAARALRELDPAVVLLPFNPTAENMADHLLSAVGPVALEGTGVELLEVTVEETARCRATATR